MVSKSKAAIFATVIAPVELIANEFPVLPPVMAKVWVCPASGSLAATVPTAVPLVEFSANENGPPVGTGGLFGGLTVIVTVSMLESGLGTVTDGLKLGRSHDK